MALHLGSVVPDFTQESTEGPIHFHEWIGDKWAVLFSHPKDFTPVCTTELGMVAKLKGEFDKRNVKVIALSVDDVNSHKRLGRRHRRDAAHQDELPHPGRRRSQGVQALRHDPSRGQRHADGALGLHHRSRTRRSGCSITYPASTGRNFHEILRVIDSLQLTDHHSVATPVNWKHGEDCVIVPSLTDPKVLKEKFPKGWRELKPYLRMTSQPPHK